MSFPGLLHYAGLGQAECRVATVYFSTKHSITTAAGEILIQIPGLGSICHRWLRGRECVVFHPVLVEYEIDKEREE